MLDCVPGLEVGATLHGPVEHGVEGDGGPLRGWTALHLDQLGCLLKMITMTEIFVFLMLHDRPGNGGPFLYRAALYFDQWAVF